MADILILGAGFGGLAAAAELRSINAGLKVTIVDRSDRFFMGFAKLWDLAGIRDLKAGTRRLDGLGGGGVRVLNAEVTGIDPAGRVADTSAGMLNADAMLVALGAEAAPGHKAMLSGPKAHDLYDASSLPAMRAALGEIERGRVVISILGAPFKCPPAPFEAALIVDDLLRKRGVRDAVSVAISTPQAITLPAAGPDASAFVAGHLADHDIELLTDRSVSSVDHGAGALSLSDGSQLEFDLLLGVPAASPPAPVAPLAAPSGWIEPDRHTMATKFQRVYAVGDCTAVPTAKGQLPKAGVFAESEGKVAAANMAADLGLGTGDSMQGTGFCFLEFPGRRVAFLEGDFYAEPAPVVQITEASSVNYEQKVRFEAERLAAWFGD